MQGQAESEQEEGAEDDQDENEGDEDEGEEDDDEDEEELSLAERMRLPSWDPRQPSGAELATRQSRILGSRGGNASRLIGSR